jgi:hypothetical protein
MRPLGTRPGSSHALGIVLNVAVTAGGAGGADEIATFAQAHGQKVRGHTLVDVRGS